MRAAILVLLLASAHLANCAPPADEKTTVCHHEKKLTVSRRAAAAHAKHGDRPVLAADVLCNNVDDDCDGKIDEEFTGLPSECGPATFFCLGGELQTYTVPPGVTGVLIDARGAAGYGPLFSDGSRIGGVGGAGGRVLVQHAVTPGDELIVYVGCAATDRNGGAGYGNGGNGGAGGDLGVDGGGGGGSAAVLDAAGEIVMAGGGGGAGGNQLGNNKLTGPEEGPWGGPGGYGTNPPTVGGNGECNGVGCTIARGGCAGCSGQLGGGNGHSVSGTFGGGGGGGGAGFDGGDGGEGAQSSTAPAPAVQQVTPPPPDVGEAGGGGGGQSWARDQAPNVVFLPSLDGPGGSVTIQPTSVGWQLFPCDPDATDAAEFVVDPRTTAIQVEAVGGSGFSPPFGGKYRLAFPNGPGGMGGILRTTIPVGTGSGHLPPQKLLVWAGCQGASGGNGFGVGGKHGESSGAFAQDGGGGGGGSTILFVDQPLPLLTAGGGGGGGGSWNAAGGAGGDGGAAGSNDGHPGRSPFGGAGAGGTGGQGDPNFPYDGAHGSDSDAAGGGGGGGGWFGGGGGHSGDGAGGGAGGTSMTDASYAPNPTITVASAGADGYVLLSIIPTPPAVIKVVSGSGQSAALGTKFANPLVARATDLSGTPSANVLVNFVTSGSGGASGTFPDGSQTAGAYTDANGIATSPLVAAAVAAGDWEAAAFLTGVNRTQDATFQLTNLLLPTATTLSIEPAVPTPNQPAVLTATVTSDQGPIPTGQIVFTVQGVQHGVPLTQGQAVLPLQAGALALGQSTVTAAYAGDASHAGSIVSSPLDVVPTPTSVSIFSPINPALPGSPVTFSTHVAVPAGAVPCVGCTMTFESDGALLATVAVDATYDATGGPFTNLPVGTHTITATFDGGPTFAASSTSLSQVIGALMQVSSNVYPVQYGNDLVLEALVVGPSQNPTQPTGTVSFVATGARCLNVPVGTNRASCDLGNALPPGTYDFEVSYSGDAVYPPTKATFSIPVLETATVTTISAPASTPQFAPFQVNVTVARQQPATLPLSGLVQLLLDGQPYSDESFVVHPDGTVVSITVSIFGTGQHTLRAEYGGAGGYGASAAETTIQVTAQAVAADTGPGAKKATGRRARP